MMETKRRRRLSIRVLEALCSDPAGETIADEVRALEEERDLLLAIDAASCAGAEAAGNGAPVDTCPHPHGPLAVAWRGGWHGMATTLERDRLRAALEVDLSRWQSLPSCADDEAEVTHEADSAVHGIRKALGWERT